MSNSAKRDNMLHRAIVRAVRRTNFLTYCGFFPNPKAQINYYNRVVEKLLNKADRRFKKYEQRQQKRKTKIRENIKTF